MNKGLYFYKLVSPYGEDVTKDCKLTINEIDSNFITLKNAEINNAHVDEVDKKLILTRENGEELVMNLTEVVAHNLDVDYNSVDGMIEITYDGKKHVIKGIVTKDNLSKEILTKVFSDSTLEGIGTSASPLGIASTQKTGHYKTAIEFLDTTMNEHLPHNGMKKGDRYVTLEEVSDYGMLYNYEGVRHINKLLQKSGWRVATKHDWDSMLNAIEPCEYRNHASTLNNSVLGYMAGSLLKSVTDWRTNCAPSYKDKPHHKHHKGDFDGDLAFGDVECGCHGDSDLELGNPNKDKFPHHPEEPKNSPMGKDAYGMGILPAGYAYYSRPMQYNQFGFQGAYWTSDMIYDTDVYTKVFDAKESGVLQIGERPSAFLSIRLVKDYDGNNQSDVENILGDNYKTVLMPSFQNPNGYAIWTAQNFRLRERNLEAVVPNAGLGVHRNKVFYLNEWNGFKWEKLEMTEGDSITILKGETWNENYRIIEGKLINTTKFVTDKIRHEIKEDLDSIRGRINEVEQHVIENEEHLEDLDKCIAEINAINKDQDEKLIALREDLTAEEFNRKEKDDDLQNQIDALKEKNDNDLEDSKKETEDRFEEVEGKIEDLEKKQEELEEKQKELEEKQEELEKKQEELDQRQDELDQAIQDETTAREEADKELQDNIDKEAEDREAADKALQDNIDKEAEDREEADKALQDNIDAEQKAREDADVELQEAIDAEQERAEAKEQELFEHQLKPNGSYYDDKEGKLTLETENPDNNIEITFSFDFGTL